MAWRLARSLDELRTQIDEHAPKRSRASDGSIGDARHQAEASDHNVNGAGVVTAIDITNDPAHRADMDVLAELLRESRDERIAYVIWDRRIFDGPHKSGTGGGGVDPWAWRPYSGSSPHTDHLHVSVAGDPKLYDDPAPWLRDRALRRGDSGPDVRTLQRALARAGYLAPDSIDGDYGPVTEAAVNQLKHRHGWTQDGIAGPRVRKALGL